MSPPFEALSVHPVHGNSREVGILKATRPIRELDAWKLLCDGEGETAPLEQIMRGKAYRMDAAALRTVQPQTVSVSAGVLTIRHAPNFETEVQLLFARVTIGYDPAADMQPVVVLTDPLSTGTLRSMLNVVKDEPSMPSPSSPSAIASTWLFIVNGDSGLACQIILEMCACGAFYDKFEELYPIDWKLLRSVGSSSYPARKMAAGAWIVEVHSSDLVSGETEEGAKPAEETRSASKHSNTADGVHSPRGSRKERTGILLKEEGRRKLNDSVGEDASHGRRAKDTNEAKTELTGTLGREEGRRKLNDSVGEDASHGRRAKEINEAKTELSGTLGREEGRRTSNDSAGEDASHGRRAKELNEAKTELSGTLGREEGRRKSNDSVGEDASHGRRAKEINEAKTELSGTMGREEGRRTSNDSVNEDASHGRRAKEINEAKTELSGTLGREEGRRKSKDSVYEDASHGRRAKDSNDVKTELTGTSGREEGRRKSNDPVSEDALHGRRAKDIKHPESRDEAKTELTGRKKRDENDNDELMRQRKTEGNECADKKDRMRHRFTDPGFGGITEDVFAAQLHQALQAVAAREDQRDAVEAYNERLDHRRAKRRHSAEDCEGRKSKYGSNVSHPGSPPAASRQPSRLRSKSAVELWSHRGEVVELTFMHLETSTASCSSSCAVPSVKVLRSSSVVAEGAMRHELAHVVMASGHPNIVRLLGVCNKVENPVDGVSIWSLIVEGSRRLLAGELHKAPLIEATGRLIFRDVFSAAAHLHSRGIVHRDIAPPNVLLMTRRNVLTGFGLAASVSEHEELLMPVGRPGYVPPEVLQAREDCGTKIDMFAIGVMLYYAMSRSEPFAAAKPDIVRKKTLKGYYDFDGARWSDVSSNCREMVDMLLRPQPKRRIAAQQALSSCWLGGAFDAQALEKLGDDVSDPRRLIQGARRRRHSKLRSEYRSEGPRDDLDDLILDELDTGFKRGVTQPARRSASFEKSRQSGDVELQLTSHTMPDLPEFPDFDAVLVEKRILSTHSTPLQSLCPSAMTSRANSRHGTPNINIDWEDGMDEEEPQGLHANSPEPELQAPCIVTIGELVGRKDTDKEAAAGRSDKDAKMELPVSPPMTPARATHAREAETEALTTPARSTLEARRLAPVELARRRAAVEKAVTCQVDTDLMSSPTTQSHTPQETEPPTTPAWRRTLIKAASTAGTSSEFEAELLASRPVRINPRTKTDSRLVPTGIHSPSALRPLNRVKMEFETFRRNHTSPGILPEFRSLEVLKA